MKHRPPRDVIFDFDGVLADSAPLIVEILGTTIAREVGIDVPAVELRSVVGPPFAEAVAILCERHTVPPSDPRVHAVIDSFRADYARRAASETVWFEGIPGAIREIRESARTTICSSKPRELVRSILTAWDMSELFDRVEAPALGSSEPKARGLTRLVSELGMDVDACALVGDTLFDGRAAASAGMPFIGVAWGIDPPNILREHGAVMIVEQPCDLPAAISQVGTRR
jgi:phosphoglycolate phosphatase